MPDPMIVKVRPVGADFTPLTDEELAPVKQVFGEDFKLAERELATVVITYAYGKDDSAPPMSQDIDPTIRAVPNYRGVIRVKAD